MGPRIWKFVAVLLVFLIAISFEYGQEFHSIQAAGIIRPINDTGNGAMIIIEAFPNVNVRINISLSFAGLTNGNSSQIYLLNGTQYTLNSSNHNINVIGEIKGHWVGYSGGGGIGFGIQLYSNGTPIGLAVVTNFSYSDFNSQYIKSVSTMGTNFFAIYVTNSSNYYVKAVAMLV